MINKKIMMFAVAAATAMTVSAAPNIVPAPKTLKAGSGFFTFKGTEKVNVTDWAGDSVASAFAVMRPELQKASGAKLEAGKDGRIVLRVNPKLGEEAYGLNVTPDSLIITASRPVGFFYGLQTLRQLMPVVAERPTAIEAVAIEDEPRFGWRGFMLDEGRHFFGKEAVKRVIDMMALYKMNRFHWHLTEDQGWRLEVKGYPKLTTDAATRKGMHLGWGNNQTADEYTYGPYFYTQQDIRDVVDYAKKRYIEILPEIDMPGHMQAVVAAYPQFACDPESQHEVWNQAGVSYDVLNVANPKVVKFASDVLDQVTDLFPFGYIHLGGDECPVDKWKENKQCQKRLQEIGSEDYRDLQHDFYGKLIANLKAKGKNHKLIFWNEVLHGNTNLIGKDNKDIVIMSWVDWEKAGRDAVDRGMNTIMTPIIPYYINRKQYASPTEPYGAGSGTETLRAVYAYEPYTNVKEERKPQYIGVQGNFWTEWVESEPNLQYLMLPRLAAIAERGWSAEKVKNYDNFRQRLKNWHADYYNHQGWNFGPHELK